NQIKINEQSKNEKEEIVDDNTSNKRENTEIEPKGDNKKATKKTKTAAPSILEKGIRHDDVKTLKVNLKKLGFAVPGSGTNLFGSQTEKKVKDFQKYYGLTVTGKVDKKTNDKINTILKTSLQRGKSHKDTKKLKADLKAIGYPVPGNGTTFYGVDTETVVKKFQKEQKLIVNGIADEVTLKKISSLQNPSVLENGVRHNNVKTLKVNLKKLGFSVPGNGTNFYGSQTEKKVKDFQKYYGLPVTGKVDTKTNDKIKKNINSSLQRGKNNVDVKQLKVDLIIIGFPVPGNGTSLFGKETETVVKQFQKNQKLIVNGIVDDVTSNKIALLKKTDPVVLANSVRHKKVKTLKINLQKLGFKVPGYGTELFGSATEKKVKEFQKYYKLPVNGMVDNKTNNKINSILSSPLQKGKRHKDTKKLKTDLKMVGYPVPGNGTNLYGVETEKIVKQFQKDHKLVVNGIADDITLAKLATLIKNNSSNIKIFIDAGHGGSDPGAIAGNLKEKDLTLDIAKRIEKYLKG